MLFAIRRALLGAIVCLLVGNGVAFSSITAGDVRSHVSDFRLQVLAFDQDQTLEDRSVDITVSSAEDANAEALMSVQQALRIIDVLDSDGFFSRAKSLHNTAWDPPPQPFDVIRISAGEDDSFYEFRSPDAILVKLLVRIREALKDGLAALSVDRAISALDPGQTRWVVQKNVPEIPQLPPGNSPAHPEHAFAPIEKTWKVRESYLKPQDGEFMQASPPDPTAPDKYHSWFHEFTCSDASDQRDLKTIILYPSGKIYSEEDSLLTGVDFPAGDQFLRLFDPAGVLIFYSHRHDGRTTDATVFNTTGKLLGSVTHGSGHLQEPTFDQSIMFDTWYYEGLVLMRTKVQNGYRLTSTWNDNTEQGKAASLKIDRNGVEVLLQDQLQWVRHADGTVTKTYLYESRQDTSTEMQRKAEYAAARDRFAVRFSARAQAAGCPHSVCNIQNR